MLIYSWVNTNKTRRERGELGYLQAMISGLGDKTLLKMVVTNSKGTIWGDMAAVDLAGMYYLSGDLKEAQKYLMEVSSKEFPIRTIYYSYMYSIKNDLKQKDALDMLGKASSSSKFKSIRHFFKLKLAERLITDGKFSEAKNILKEISDDPFSPYKAHAENLLKVVNAFAKR